MTFSRGTLILAIFCGLPLTGCADDSGQPVMNALEVSKGASALQSYGCGACHHIPGVAGANSVVGPPLLDMKRRVYIARGLPNTPENMIRWIRSPEEIAPGSAMPNMQVTAEDAKAMTMYLYRAQ